MDHASTQAEKLRIRVTKEASAFVYFILEAQEGVTAYSTLPNKQGDEHRDLELCFSPEFKGEVLRVLEELLKSQITIQMIQQDSQT
ncbi:MAG: hypothetical protein KA715_07140 [Xanthomonadaceae bacterium]|nr:hypothetical protein [Xanthomonadaceae bacterium]